MPDEIHPLVTSSDEPTNTSVETTGKQVISRDLARVIQADIVANTNAIAEINARAEMGMRNRALTLSSLLTIILLLAHIWFAYMGRPLIFSDFMNEILAAAVLAPWLGFGLGKAVLVLTDRLNVK